ncbi:MAG: TetR/AcrR family transcriptional regulator [Thermoleophilaceae bacterium]|nr:TetR/AcrR family transcriptional regulator [Thermoleophilaceae bacterium]
MARTTATPGRTQRERSAATTAELIDAARGLFAADGYAATLLEDVVREAGVTKGALYHHFAGKRELFRAVFEREQRALAAAVTDAYARERDPWEGFHAGCRSFLEASLDPGVQRITLLDAPAALGWEAMRAIEAGYSLAMLREGLEIAIAKGRIAPRPVAPLAHMLLGAICEGAMMTARSEDQPATAREVLAELTAQLDALARDDREHSPDGN